MGISLSPLLRMKLGDVIAFLTVHLVRHTQQGQRALDQARANVLTPQADHHVVAA